MTVFTVQPDPTAGIDTNNNEASPTVAAATSAAMQTSRGAGARRSLLLKFDVSSIPAGATVNSANLYLYNTSTPASNATWSFFSILATNSGWVEGATWDYANPTTQRWAGDTGANGGTDAGCTIAATDYNASALGTVTYIASTPTDTEHVIALDTAQVATWINGANYGIVGHKTDAISGIFSWRSSDYTTDITKRPKLVIDYTAGGAPITATASLTLGAMTVAATGTLAIAGSASTTLGAMTLAATGSLAISGQVTATLGALTLAATGAGVQVGINGTASITLGEMALSSLGVLESLPITGTAAIMLGMLTLVASERVPVVELAYGFVYGAASQATIYAPSPRASVYGPHNTGEVRGV